jgi:hypothetical protein
MAGLIGYREAMQGLADNLRGLQKDMDLTLDEAMLAAGIAAKEAMVNTVLTTPSSLRPGKDNRVWTGQMLHAISEPRVERRGQTRSLTAGWLDETEDYFALQDQGGPGPHGIDITPMHMLINGYQAAETVIDAWIRAEQKRA